MPALMWGHVLVPTLAKRVLLRGSADRAISRHAGPDVNPEARTRLTSRRGPVHHSQLRRAQSKQASDALGRDGERQTVM